MYQTENRGTKEPGDHDMNTVKQYASLDAAIRELSGAERRIVSRQAVSGGDIKAAHKLTLDDGSCLFMKSNRTDALTGFQAEARGLTYISRTGCIRVPELLGIGTDPDGYAFLLLEYADSRRCKRIHGYWTVFAGELANLHMHAVRANEPPRFGFPEDNYIGHTKQINTWHESWISFFRECRLGPQFQMASACFDRSDRRHITHLMDHLDEYLTEPSAPSLIHGDLWGGNVMTGSDGKACLIDPAAYYGHPEADLAMTELFGGFPTEFYHAYCECMDLVPGYPDRRDLYNLYHLLNHLNMFGSSYLHAVRRILERY